MGDPYKIEWAPVAVRDLDDILEYVALHDGPERAGRLYARIRGPDTLSKFPRRCRVVPELRDLGITEYRELIFAPFRLFFRIRGRVVSIVGVLDGRRDIEEILIKRALE